MHDAHDSGDHGHHALPPPEPDTIAFLPILGWGFGTFLLVVACIGLLGGYFWMEIRAEENVKVFGSKVPATQVEAEAVANKRVTTYRKLENGKVQIPVEQAMQVVATERR